MAVAPAAGAAGEPCGGDADRPAGPRVLRGFRVAHVFDIAQADGDPLSDITPELLTGDAPAALWDALAAQIATHGYTLTREDCGAGQRPHRPGRPHLAGPPGRRRRARRSRPSPTNWPTSSAGTTAEGYDSCFCRGQAEAEAESVAYIVTAWAGLDAGAYTVPYVAAWSAGNTGIVRAAAATVPAASSTAPRAPRTRRAMGEPPRRADRPRSPRAPRPRYRLSRESAAMPATRGPGDNTRTESTATPQSTEGEPARTTTTTVAALNTGRETTPDEPSATENAHGAGLEQRETEHVDPAGTGTTSAGMAEDSARAHRLVWLDPPGAGRASPATSATTSATCPGWPTPSPPKACWRPSP